MYNDLAGSVQGVDKFILLLQKLNQSKTEKERIAQEVCELLNDGSGIYIEDFDEYLYINERWTEIFAKKS